MFGVIAMPPCVLVRLNLGFGHRQQLVPQSAVCWRDLCLTLQRTPGELDQTLGDGLERITSGVQTYGLLMKALLSTVCCLS